MAAALHGRRPPYQPPAPPSPRRRCSRFRPVSDEDNGAGVPLLPCFDSPTFGIGDLPVSLTHRSSNAGLHLKERTIEEHQHMVQGIFKRDEKRRKRLAAAGIDYECPDFHGSSRDATSDARDVREHLVVDVEGVDGLSSLPTNVKLRVQNLTRQSETGQPILSRVNLDIPVGLIVGIIGPSGSGKSTLLRALNRMWEPSESTVFLDNQDICQLDVLSLRRHVGMLFQLPALFTGFGI